MAKKKGAYYQDVIADIKKGIFKPVYALCGKEPYYIDLIEKELRLHVLQPNEKDFNETIFYGRDVDVHTVTDTAERYPMMAARQLVVVREAQDLEDFYELENYAKDLTETTVLVICYKGGTLDGRKNLTKLIKEKGCYFEAQPIYDNQVPDWIANYLKNQKIYIDDPEATLLAEYLGSQLSKVAKELDKLALNIPEGEKVSREDIEKYIGISKDYNIFELQRNLAFRKAENTMRIAHYYGKNTKEHPIQMIIAVLYSYFSKIYVMHGMQGKSPAAIQRKARIPAGFVFKEYIKARKAYSKKAVEKVFDILYAYDRRSKGLDGDRTEDAELIREMIYLIYHAAETKTVTA